MARTEARIFTSIWSDPDFLSLPVGAQRMYVFRPSQRELSYCGVMPYRPSRWVPKAAGLTMSDVERDLKELEGTAYPSAASGAEEAPQGAARRPFGITDQDTGEIFVRSMLRRDNAWKQPNLLKQAIDSTEDLESPRIRAALLAEVCRLPIDESPSEQVKTLIAEWAQTLDQGTAYPSAYPDPDHADNPADLSSGNPEADSSDDTTENHRPRTGSSVLPFSVPLSPTSSSAPPARDRKQGTRLPEDFQPTPEMRTWFVEHCPHVDGLREHERFADYWRGKAGKDGREVDWPATWRNWMRTAEDRAGPRQRDSAKRGHQPYKNPDDQSAYDKDLKDA